MSQRERDGNDWFQRIPNWMQPHGEANVPEKLQFFIRTDSGEHFETALDASNHRQLESYPSIPEFAKVLIGTNIYTTVGHFSFYNPENFHSFYDRNFPPLNQIYVKMPRGPIYSAEVVTQKWGASSSH